MAFVSMFLIFLLLIIGILVLLARAGIRNIRTYRQEKRSYMGEGKKPKKIQLIWGGMLLAIPVSCVLLVVGLFVKTKIEYMIYDTFIERWKNIRVSDTQAKNDVIDEFIYAADNGDKEAIMSMFTRRIQNKKNFEEQIDVFLDEYPGGLYGLKFHNEGGICSEEINYGKVIGNFSYSYTVEKDGETFYISFGACYQDSYDEAKVGMEYFYIMSEEVKKLERSDEIHIDVKETPIFAQIHID